MKRLSADAGIPVSPSLTGLPQPGRNAKYEWGQKKRLVQISFIAVATAVLICLVAKVLVYLINLVTNISFYGSLDTGFNSPANNHLGLWVVVIPAIGGLLVGLMALYGSKAIRGHGIPEAMEQILVNQSKIKPSIAFLKPVSAAIAIGTGGPFGAEGPIIATGGALGSTLGQFLKITSNERKIILASGATAGMSAIFGTPIAAIFLAIELLLFEFSPKAILPVALACITGAAGHHLLFEAGPVFSMPDLAAPSNVALGVYSFIGILIGFISLGLTKIVYVIEDAFEQLPVHWMWWPAMGGLAVGVIGYFAPHTLGVGYDNIINILSGTFSFALLVRLCFLKFLSWSIALGSGTSGGTLAPLLTIGGAGGAIAGTCIMRFFPESGITIPMAALIGMSAMFAGASRAYLTSITFALEATMQSNALLPLLGACTAAYLISFFFMKNTIMTEKIARRGIHTPSSYEPDILSKVVVAQVIKKDRVVLSSENTVSAIRDAFTKKRPPENHFIVTRSDGTFEGITSLSKIYHKHADGDASIASVIKQRNYYIKEDESLAKAVELMSASDIEFLPVLSSRKHHTVVGVLTYKDILKAYKIQIRDNQEKGINLSLKRQRIKILVKGKQLLANK